MTSKPDFEARLAKREPVAAPAPDQKLIPEKKPESRKGKKLLSAWVSKDEHLWLKREAVDHETTMDALIAEAIGLLHKERGSAALPTNGT